VLCWKIYNPSLESVYNTRSENFIKNFIVNFIELWRKKGDSKKTHISSFSWGECKIIVLFRTYLWWSPSDDYTLGVMSMNSKWWQGARTVSKESGIFFHSNKETKLWNMMILLFYSNFVIPIMIFICFIAPRAKQILIFEHFWFDLST